MAKGLSRRGFWWMGLLIGSVWVFHGLYSKILDGVPRHRMIVAKILGDDLATRATLVIGALEILLGIWAWSGRWRRLCACVQILAIATMNTLEIRYARELLISAPGMLALNALFLCAVGYWAFADRYRSHPA